MFIEEVTEFTASRLISVKPTEPHFGQKAMIGKGFSLLSYGDIGNERHSINTINDVDMFSPYHKYDVFPFYSYDGAFVISPSYIDLGVISESFSFNLTCCNNYNYATYLNKASITGESGALIFNDLNVINEDWIYMPANSCIDLEIQINADSDTTTIDVVIAMEQLNGGSDSVVIVGRIDNAGLKFNANAKNVVGSTSEIEYRIKYLKSVDGTEYKVIRDMYPVENIGASFIQESYGLVDWVNRVSFDSNISIVNYFYAIYHCAQISKGDTEINGNFTGVNINNLGSVLLQDGSTNESVTVEEITKERLVLKEPVQNNYLKPIITPITSLTITDFASTEYTNKYRIDLQAKRKYYQPTPIRSDIESDLKKLNGLYVFPFAYNSNEVQKTIDSGMNIRDYDRGVWDHELGYNEKEKSFTITVNFLNLAEYQQLVDFHDLLLGGYNDFYLPSYHHELQLANTELITNKVFSVDNPHTGEFNGHNAIFFRVGDDITLAEITQYEYDESTQITTMTLSEDVNIYPDEICYCGWVSRARIDGAIKSTRQPYLFTCSINILEWY